MTDDPKRVRITHIKIVLSGGGSEQTILERDSDYVWSITGAGKLYPRHMKFMAELNQMAREVDS